MSKLAQLIVRLRDWSNQHPARLPWCVALIAGLALFPSVWGGFSMDDHFFHIVMDGFPDVPALKCSPVDIFAFADGQPARNAVRMEYGMPWWAPANWQIAFFRPLTAFTHWLDWTLFGNTAWPMHVHGVLIYMALAFFATKLYQQIAGHSNRGAPPWIAGLAGLFFAIDTSHGLTAGWIANRNAVLAALFVILTLYFHCRWRRDGWRPGVYCACVSLSVALLCAEAGVTAGAYLFAYALFLDKGAGSRPSVANIVKRMASIAPYLVVVMLWQIPYKALGYGVISSRLYTDPTCRPVEFAAKAIQYWPMLLFSELAAGEPTIWNYLPGPLAAAYLGLALFFLAAVAWLAWPLFRRSAETRFWAVSMMLAALPTCAVFPQARLLMCTSIGAMGLVAVYVGWRLEPCGPARVESPRRARFSYGLLAIWIGLHGLVAAALMPMMSLSPMFVENTVRRDFDQMPSDPAVRNDTIVVVNALADVWGIFLPVIRMSTDQPVPRRCYELAAGARNLSVRREDERTLVLRYGDEFLANEYTLAFRNPAKDPLVPGYTVRMERMTVEVREVTPDGRPREAAFHFDAPLEDPSFRWMAYQDGAVKPFTPPRIGRMARVNNPDMYEVVCKLLGVPEFAGSGPSWIDTPLFAWLHD